MTSDRINEIYYGKALSAKSQSQAQERVEWIQGHAVGSAVLDIGCSQGINAILLARSGKEVTAIDVDEETINHARKELSIESEEARKRVTLIHGDALQYSFNDNSYDTVIMGQLIEHVENPCAFLDLARRACKPGGRVIITTPFGLLDHPDHKDTFYLYQFIELVSPYFTLEELDIVGKRICFIGGPKKTSASRDSGEALVIDEKWNRRIHELTEREFERAERESHEKLTARAEAIKKLRGEIQVQQDTIKKLRGEIQVQQDTVKKLRGKKEGQRGQIKDQQGQIRALKASMTYRTGSALVNASRSPRGIITLPVALFRIYWGYRSKGKVGWEAKVEERSGSTGCIAKGTISPERGRILFMPTNGAGLGHVTRLLAIARRLRMEPCIKECIFLTTSDALNIFRREGFVAYHVPSPESLKDRIETHQWNSYARNQLELIMKNHEIDVFIFDGVYPYSGIISATSGNKKLFKVWVKRGMMKEGLEEKTRDLERFFDLRIVPGELGQRDVSRDSAGQIIVPPIIFLKKDELLSRQEVISMLRLDPQKKTVFVQVGAGNVGDMHDQVEVIVDTLRQFESVQVVLADSLIARNAYRGCEGIRIVRDYPLSRYYNGFDVAISAAGYNTFVELIYFGLPSIFIPNLETKSDDQLARASLCEETGTGLVLHSFSSSQLKEYLTILLDAS